MFYCQNWIVLTDNLNSRQIIIHSSSISINSSSSSSQTTTSKQPKHILHEKQFLCFYVFLCYCRCCSATVVVVWQIYATFYPHLLSATHFFTLSYQAPTPHHILIGRGRWNKNKKRTRIEIIFLVIFPRFIAWIIRTKFDLLWKSLEIFAPFSAYFYSITQQKKERKTEKFFS